jgi:hypothetical protein
MVPSFVNALMRALIGGSEVLVRLVSEIVTLVAKAKGLSLPDSLSLVIGVLDLEC